MKHRLLDTISPGPGPALAERLKAISASMKQAGDSAADPAGCAMETVQVDLLAGLLMVADHIAAANMFMTRDEVLRALLSERLHEAWGWLGREQRAWEKRAPAREALREQQESSPGDMGDDLPF